MAIEEIKEVNEGSTSYHPISFLGKDNEPVVPEKLRFRLVTGEQQILIDWTEIATDSVEIEIASSYNKIVAGVKKRYLTVEVTHNGGDVITEELPYTIVNLKGVP